MSAELGVTGVFAVVTELARTIPVDKPARMAGRGTSNGNDRGSSAARAARRAWLVETFRANSDLSSYTVQPHPWYPPTREMVPFGSGEPACRCYRCGLLMTEDSLTVDRIVPGCDGGTYRRNNIRPACGPCNSETGGKLAHRKAKR